MSKLSVVGLLFFGLVLTGCEKIKRTSAFAFNRYQIKTPSMSPNLNIGDEYGVISVDSFKINQYGAYHPIKKFRRENVNVVYISRIIGLPGDSIEMKSGKVFVNGKKYPFKVNLK